MERKAKTPNSSCNETGLAQPGSFIYLLINFNTANLNATIYHRAVFRSTHGAANTSNLYLGRNTKRRMSSSAVQGKTASKTKAKKRKKGDDDDEKEDDDKKGDTALERLLASCE
jgi:phosphopantothenoylcysteine synthetase/decarboxylase